MPCYPKVPEVINVHEVPAIDILLHDSFVERSDLAHVLCFSTPLESPSPFKVPILLVFAQMLNLYIHVNPGANRLSKSSCISRRYL